MARFKINVFSVTLLIILVLSFFLGCRSSTDDFNRIAGYAAPFRFNIFTWEVKTLAGRLVGPISIGLKYSSDSEEKLIEARIREAFFAQGIYNPAGNFLKIGFPPVTLFLGPPPRLLVVSPRYKIESIDEITLSPAMTAQEIESMEGEVEKLGYSALVVDLGGIATVPSYVSNDADMKYILESTAHEWVHQYLAFMPLGFRYVLDELGIKQSRDVITLNETVADMIGNEIGDAVYQKYYAPPATGKVTARSSRPAFDFNGAMRRIRQTVDAYLARGEIDTAESYMDTQRDYLAANGYQIRKLNQAFFAFHGTYADSPASASPIGRELETLREQSASLKNFLNKVSAMTSVEDLDKAVR